MVRAPSAPCLHSMRGSSEPSTRCVLEFLPSTNMRSGAFFSPQQFATALEAAYPMRLARARAACFVLALQRRGIRMPPETISELHNEEFASLPALRAQAGLQSRAPRLPPLIPAYASKVALTGYQADLPQFDLNGKCNSHLNVLTTNAPTVLPKGSKLLHITPAMLPESCLQGGGVCLRAAFTTAGR